MRLIDADYFIEYLRLDAENSREINLGEIVTLEDFDRQPTIDAEPVRHGRLINVGTDEWYARFGDCSICGESNHADAKYCQWCGAKMDGESGVQE